MAKKRWYLPDGTFVDIEEGQPVPEGLKSSIADLTPGGFNADEFVRRQEEARQRRLATQPPRVGVLPPLTPQPVAVQPTTQAPRQASGQVATQQIPPLTEPVKPLIDPDVGGSLRNLLLRLYPEKIQPALGRGLTVEQLEGTILTELQDEMANDPDLFLTTLARKLQPKETRALLDYLGLPSDISDQVIGTGQAYRQMTQTIGAIPEFKGLSVDGLVDLLEKSPQDFIEIIRTGSLTPEKQELLKLLGISPSQMFQGDKPLAEIIAGQVEASRNIPSGVAISRLSSDVESAKGKEKAKFGDRWDGLLKNWVELVPFASSIADFGEFSAINRAANAIEAGEAVGETELRLLTDFLIKAQRDTTWGYKVMDVIAQMPAFAGEIAATGGLFTAGKKGAEKVATSALKKFLQRSIEGKLAQLATKGVGTAVGAGVAAIPAAAIKTPAGIQERQAMTTLTGDEESVLRSAVKAFGQQWVEAASERMGGVATPISNAVKGQLLKSGLFRAIAKLNPGRTMPEIQRLFERVGYNGVFGEMLEERIADVGHGLLAAAGLGDQPLRLPSLQQLSVEMAAFALPGVSAMAISNAPAIPGIIRDINGKIITNQLTKSETGREALGAVAQDTLQTGAMAMGGIGQPAEIMKTLPNATDNAVLKATQETFKSVGLDVQAVRGIAPGEYWVSISANPKINTTGNEYLKWMASVAKGNADTKGLADTLGKIVYLGGKGVTPANGGFLPFKNMEDAQKFLKTGDTSLVLKNLNLKGQPWTQEKRLATEQALAKEMPVQEKRRIFDKYVESQSDSIAKIDKQIELIQKKLDAIYQKQRRAPFDYSEMEERTRLEQQKRALEMSKPQWTDFVMSSRQDLEKIARKLEGKQPSAPEVTPAAQSITPEVLGQQIAASIGVRFEGVQQGSKNVPDMMLFTDPQTGTTLAARSEAELTQKLAESRAKFGEVTPPQQVDDVAQPASAQKEAWQMTREEWGQTKWAISKDASYAADSIQNYPSRYSRGDLAGALGATAKSVSKDSKVRYVYAPTTKGLQAFPNTNSLSPVESRYWRVSKEGDSIKVQEFTRDITINESDHRKGVIQALSEGKPVPPEVLNDYPDLVKQAQQAATVKENLMVGAPKYPATPAGAEARATAEGIGIAEASQKNASDALQKQASVSGLPPDSVVPSGVDAALPSRQPDITLSWYRGTTKSEVAGQDTFWTSDRSVAGDYGTTKVGKKPKITKIKPAEMPENIYEAGDKPSLADELGIKTDYNDPAFDQEVKRILSAQGYDAVHYGTGTLDAEELHIFGKKPQPPATTQELGTLNPVLVEKWHSWNIHSPSNDIGTVGELIQDEATRQHFKDVLNVPVLAADVKGQGALGVFRGQERGKPVIYLDPSATERTFWEEVIHAQRAAKGRSMANEGDYLAQAKEISAKRGSTFFAQNQPEPKVSQVEGLADVKEQVTSEPAVAEPEAQEGAPPQKPPDEVTTETAGEPDERPLTPIQKVRAFYKEKLADLKGVMDDKVASLKDWANWRVEDKQRVAGILTDYIQANLPLRERGKLLDLVKNIKSQEALDAAIERIDRMAETSLQRDLRTKIVSELKSARPRKVEGIVKGRFGGDVQSELDGMRSNLKVTRDEVLAKINANQQSYEDGKMLYEDMVRENSRLAFVGIEGMTSAELQETLDFIKNIKEIGRSIRTQELEKWQEGIDKAKTDITRVITKGVAVEPGVTKEFTGFKGLLKLIEGGNVALTDFLDILSGTDKTSKPYSSALNLFVDDRVLKSYNAEQDGLVETGDTIRDNFKRVFNTKNDREANDILRRMGKDKVNLGTFTNTEGKGVNLGLTKGQMIDAYNLMQSPTNLPTFIEGNKFTQEMQDAISNGLTTQEKAWADWQRSFLADYWTGINDIYEPLYGVKLGRNENYWPRNRDIERSDVPEHILVQEDYNHFASVTNGSLKARTQNKIPFKFLDANTKLLNHITQMEHYKAWANTIRDLRSVFMSRDIKNAIHQFYGREIANKIDDYISVLARGGIEKAKRVHILDTLRGNVAVASLGLKPMIAIKQPIAMLAYATEMPFGDFVTGVADFLKNPLANYKMLYEKSSSLRARYRAGQYERDIKVGVEGGAPTSLSGKATWKERVLTLIQLGDQFGTVPGMWAKYQSELKAGATDAQAILEAEKLTNRTQNTSQLFTQSTIQHGGSWARLMTMFQDSPNKYFRLINSNFRNMINGRQGTAKSVSNLVLLWVVMPVLFQWMSDAFKWRPERQLRAAALGPVNMLLIFGQAAQSVVGWATGEKYPYEPSPVLQIADDIQVAISKMRKMIADGQDPFKDIALEDVIDMAEYFVKALGTATGVPTPYLVQLERMARGQDGKKDWRELLFSRWALEDPKPDLNEKSNDARLKLGLLKETTGKEDTDKLPDISNTADYFSEQKENLRKTLPADITAKNGFDMLAVAVGQAFVAEDEYLSQPNKALYKIVDDMEKDESLNYTITQYYLDWQTRSKITSLAKLKEFDETHPRAFLGNLTPKEHALLVEYENTPKEKRKQFLEDHPELGVNKRQEWLKANTKENALLALFGQTKVLTRKAYDEAMKLAKELDIPDSALPEDIKIPKGSEDGYFKWLDAEDKTSYEIKLTLVKDKKLADYIYGDNKPKWFNTPQKALEIGAKNQANFDKVASYGQETSPDYIPNDALRGQAVADFYATPEGIKFTDDKHRMAFIEQWGATSKDDAPDPLIEAYVGYRKALGEGDKHSILSNPDVANALADNPDLATNLMDVSKWGDKSIDPIPTNLLRPHADFLKLKGKGTVSNADAFNLVDQATGKLSAYGQWRFDNKMDIGALKNADTGELDFSKLPIWKIDAQYAEQDKAFNDLPDNAKARAEWLAKPENANYAIARRQRDAYGKGLTGDMVDKYVSYYQLPTTGHRRKRYLQQNPDFAQAVGLEIPAKIPSEKLDDLNDKMADQDEEYAAITAVSAKRAYLADNPEYANDLIRRKGYEAYVPDNQIENYVLYETEVTKAKREGKEDDYQDEWFLQENEEFYENVYLNILGKEDVDFSKVPTREVYAKFLIYDGINDRKAEIVYRKANPDLEEWLQRAKGLIPVDAARTPSGSSDIISRQISLTTQIQELLEKQRRAREFTAR